MAPSQPNEPSLTTDQLEVALRNGGFGPWSAASTPNLRIVSSEPNLLVATVPVVASISNSFGNLHGGAIATMIDALTSAAMIAADPRESVTVDLNLTCVSGAPVGTTVTIESRVEHVGRSMVFGSCRVYAPADGEGGGDRALVATGTHTKKIVGPTWDRSELSRWAGSMSKM